MKWHMMSILFCLGMMADAATDAEVKDMIDKVPPHPRLLLLKGGEKSIIDKLGKDPQLNAVWELIRKTADADLTAPDLERKVEGRRLLNVSRECLKRVLNQSLSYRLTGERKYADRAVKDMLTAAAFTDWNPSHFLDVAEMTAALAIGTDWLHDCMDDATRSTLHKAIIEKGLKASIGKDYWAKGVNNWNQVCNGGMVLGALAIKEDDPELAQKMILRAVEGVPLAMKEYEPDGAYPEGPMYWDYGTTYNVLMIDALEKATGSDCGLSRMKGFGLTANYYLHATGPTGLYFNYADCSQRGSFNPSPSMYWFAARQKDQGVLWNERPMLEYLQANPAKVKSSGRFLPLLLLWAEANEGRIIQPAKKSYYGGGVTPVVVLRSGWDREASFVGIKGGKTGAPHGHMDAGTFVIDAMGERWAEDLGMENYHGIESKGMNLWGNKADSDRWRIFRLGASAHNVLMIDGKDHQIDGAAKFVEHTDNSAELDMSAVFAGQLKSAMRKIVLNPDGSILLSDKIDPGEDAVTVRWAMMTRAEVEISAGGAILRRNGKALEVRLRGLPGITMKTYVSDPPPNSYDSPNPGTRMVGFEVRLGNHEKLNLEIDFVTKR